MPACGVKARHQGCRPAGRRWAWVTQEALATPKRAPVPAPVPVPAPAPAPAPACRAVAVGQGQGHPLQRGRARRAPMQGREHSRRRRKALALGARPCWRRRGSSGGGRMRWRTCGIGHRSWCRRPWQALPSRRRFPSRHEPADCARLSSSRSCTARLGSTPTAIPSTGSPARAPCPRAEQWAATVRLGTVPCRGVEPWVVTQHASWPTASLFAPCHQHQPVVQVAAVSSSTRGAGASHRMPPVGCSHHLRR